VALPPRDLGDDVRGRAEPVQAKTLGVAGEHERAIADQPCAEERSRFHIRVELGNGEAVPLVGDRLLGEATVDLVPGKTRAIAEVLSSGPAEATGAVGPSEPRDSDTLPDRKARRTFTELADPTHDLMAEDERELGIAQLAVDDVQIGSADRACSDIQKHLFMLRSRARQLGRSQRATGSAEAHRPHGRDSDRRCITRQPAHRPVVITPALPANRSRNLAAGGNRR
jgi:hypothetical protein